MLPEEDNGSEKKTETEDGTVNCELCGLPFHPSELICCESTHRLLCRDCLQEEQSCSCSDE